MKKKYERLVGRVNSLQTVISNFEDQLIEIKTLYEDKMNEISEK